MIYNMHYIIYATYCIIYINKRIFINKDTFIYVLCFLGCSFVGFFYLFIYNFFLFSFAFIKECPGNTEITFLFLHSTYSSKSPAWVEEFEDYLKVLTQQPGLQCDRMEEKKLSGVAEWTKCPGSWFHFYSLPCCHL